MGVTTEVQVKILIVEDDPDICDLLKRVLEADGYEVETATDSAGALKAVADGAPDLVLLDVVLGGEDGRDLLVKLRQKSDVPAVFLTGRGLGGRPDRRPAHGCGRLHRQAVFPGRALGPH